MDPIISSVIVRAQRVILRRIEADQQALGQLAHVAQELPRIPSREAASRLVIALTQLDAVGRLPTDLRGMLAELRDLTEG